MDFRLQEQINELQQQLSQAYDRIDNLEEQLRQNVQTQGALSKTLRESAVAKSALLERKTEQNERLSSQLELNKIALESLQAQADQLQTELNAQKEETHFYKQEYQKLEQNHSQELKQLKTELQQREAEVATQAADAAATKAQNDSLNQQLQTQHQNTQKLNSELVELKRQNEELHEQIEKLETRELTNKESQTTLESSKIITQEQYDVLEAQCMDNLQELTTQLDEQINLANDFFKSYTSYKRKYESMSLMYDQLIAEFEKTQTLLKENDAGKLKQIIIEYSKQMTDIQLDNTKLIIQCQRLQEATQNGQKKLHESETGLAKHGVSISHVGASSMQKSTAKDQKQNVSKEQDAQGSTTGDFTISLDQLQKTQKVDIQK